MGLFIPYCRVLAKELKKKLQVGITEIMSLLEEAKRKKDF